MWQLLCGVVANCISFAFHCSYSGRDVALSDNQSPVIKFYNVTYRDYENRSNTWNGDLYPVKAMQLWNDWNLQVQTYGEDHSSTIDYLLIRSEDLLHETSRFESWQQLADFVGSQFSPKEICCLSRKTIRDQGASVAHNPKNAPNKNQDFFGDALDALLMEKRLKDLESSLKEREEHLEALNASLAQRQASLEELETSLKELETSLRKQYQAQAQHRRLLENKPPTDVQERYGKWQVLLANKTNLSKHLHEEGAEGLRVFGYEPRISYDEFQGKHEKKNPKTFQCNSEVMCES